MKKALLLVTLALCALSASAQTASRPSGRDLLSKEQQMALSQQAQPKSNYVYHLNDFRSNDDYEFTNYFYDASGRCIAIEQSQGYPGLGDYMHTFDSLRYDANGDMVRLDCYQELNGGWQYVNYCEYTYENHLLATRTNYNNFGGEFLLGGVYYFYYNAQGKISQSKLWFANEWYDETNYTYDAQGRLTQVLYRVDINFNQNLVDYQRDDYSYNAQGLRSEVLSYQANENGAMNLVVRDNYSYDSDGNCILFESKTGGGSWREKKEMQYETRLLSETLIPHTYEHPTPLTYDNKHTYHTMHYFAADQDFTLQDVCYYYYTYCGVNSIETAGTARLTLYPNPATDHLTIEAADGDLLMAIYSLDGHCVKVQRMDGTNVQVDLSHLAAGTYIVRVQGAQTRSARFSVVR